MQRLEEMMSSEKRLIHNSSRSYDIAHTGPHGLRIGPPCTGQNPKNREKRVSRQSIPISPVVPCIVFDSEAFFFLCLWMLTPLQGL